MIFRLDQQGNAFKKNLLLGMLKRLFIQNYAIIRELDLTFSDGMVIITGETGAGKSILMGALGLALGNRVDASVMRNKENKTIVEAVFEGRIALALQSILSTNELEADEEIIVRREIQVSGKSRSFINDTPVSLAVLQQVAAQLVDLHQQFDTMELGSQEFQQQLLDIRCESIDLMQEYKQIFSQYRIAAKKINDIKESLKKAEQEREFKLFLLNELQELDWKEGEGKLIDDELNLLTHADQVRTGIGKIGFGLSEGDQPLLSTLRTMISQLQALQPFHKDVPNLSDRMSSAYVELKDIAAELQDIFEKVTVDDKRMEELNDRLANAQRLSKKHATAHVDDLVGIREKIAEDLSVFERSSDELSGLEKEMNRMEAMACEHADELRKRRKIEIPQLEAATKILLKRVGMPNASLKIDLKPVELCSTGIDQAIFLFDANKSGQFEPLQKVASGGELSRLMLILKSLVAHSMELPTLIFDEIDSGISGEAAKQVGVLMEELSANHQLIAITHQPQIAAKAGQHLFVYKKEEEGQINTGIRILTQEERVQTIAQMLAGENPSEAVLASAREMMKKS